MTLFGGTGYIGQRFSEMYPVIMQPRDDLMARTPCVLYMISTTHNYHLATNPWIDIDTNITHLMRVLEQCRTVGVTEFNFVSSWFVYGPAYTPCTENMLCDPRGFYSITKRTAEQLLIEYCDHHNMAWRILRLSNVIGGQDHKASFKKNVLHTMITALCNHRDVTMANNGEFYRDYLYIDDVCDAMNHVISHASPGQIINIGSGHSVRFRQAIEFVQHQTQSQSVIHHEQRSGVIDCRLDCNKLRGLGWKPKHCWQQALSLTLRDLTA